MKFLLSALITLATPFAMAVDTFAFTCNQNGVVTTALPGIRKAPISPVVGLNIKVISTEVPLYLIKASVSNGSEKNLYATDWVSKDLLSEEGEDLMSLLSLFFSIDISKVESLRAAIPTDLLDTFAYLELKDLAGNVNKLGFQGALPTTCQ